MDASLIPAVPSPSAVSSARVFVGVGIALNIVAGCFFVGRIWTRSRPVCRLSPDDYVIVVAYILTLTDSILLFKSVPYAFGHDLNITTLADAETSLRYAIIALPIWAWSMATIKISIAFMLLRFETVRSMRRFLWAMIAFQVLLGLYNMLQQLIQCICYLGCNED